MQQSSHNVVFGDPLKPMKLDDFRNVLIRCVFSILLLIPFDTFSPVVVRSLVPDIFHLIPASDSRQEETTIFALIERAQFPLNSEVYVNMCDKCSSCFHPLYFRGRRQMAV